MTAMTNAPPLPEDEQCPHVMSKFATRLDCLEARDKWHREKITTLRAQLSAETARANANERDAKRYGWLRVNPVECANLADNQTYRYKKNKPELLDAAIDAAIGAPR